MRIRVPGEKLSDGLAWLAFILAVIGGFAATSSFIGDFIVGLVQMGPWWLACAAGVVGGLMIVGDLLDNGIPDRIRTVYITILWPSTWLSMEGKLGNHLNQWIKDMNAMLDKNLGPWISDHPTGKGTLMTGIAAVSIAFALVWAHRYAHSKKTAAAPAAGSGATAASTVAARRGRR